MKEEIKCNSEGILAQIESVNQESTYTTLTLKILQEAINQATQLIQPISFACNEKLYYDLFLKFNGVEHKGYKYYVKYHKRIKVYEFRFYKKYKQNVEFREYYNSKYEKIK